jgi:hypothetical protein
MNIRPLGSGIHVAEGLFGDIEMMVFHLLTLAGLGPAIEFLLQVVIGSSLLFGHCSIPLFRAGERFNLRATL